MVHFITYIFLYRIKFLIKSILKNIIAYAIMPIGKRYKKSNVDEEANPPTVMQHSWGILLYFYSGKASTRLVVAFVVTV